MTTQPVNDAALNPRLQEIVDDFRGVPDKDRLQLLLEFSQDLPPLPEPVCDTPTCATGRRLPSSMIRVRP